MANLVLRKDALFYCRWIEKKKAREQALEQERAELECVRTQLQQQVARTPARYRCSMSKQPPEKTSGHLRKSDIRGIVQLATQATTGVTRIVEGVHHSILNTKGIPGGRVIHSISQVVFKSVHAATFVVGKGVDAALAKLQPLLESAEDAEPGTARREAVLAALNGVMGDRLVATDNPFATVMTLRYSGHTLCWDELPPIPAATGKVLIMIHGLCMNDLQWQTKKEDPGHDHGEALAKALGYTPVYLRYNSGLHTSINGRELSVHLQQLIRHWPVRIEELTIVAHSMGGLVTRSAVNHAGQDGLSWPDLLKNIIFLGTPHHGAPLEQAGNWLDVIIGSTPYSAPFTSLVRLRSAGVTDLRLGHVVDEDWQDHDRFKRKPNGRNAVPLPADVACFTVAATTASKRGLLADHLVGDGLVPLSSALGQHRNAEQTLAFKKQSQWVAYCTNHMELLGSQAVSNQMIKWLTT